MKKKYLTYISKAILGSIIPVSFMCIYVYSVNNSNTIISMPVLALLSFIENICEKFGVYGNYIFFGIFLVLPVILIFLNGFFCFYKKIDWKIPIIIILITYNYFSYTEVGMIQPIWTVIYFVVHITGYFLGKRTLNRKYNK